MLRVEGWHGWLGTFTGVALIMVAALDRVSSVDDVLLNSATAAVVGGGAALFAHGSSGRWPVRWPAGVGDLAKCMSGGIGQIQTGILA